MSTLKKVLALTLALAMVMSLGVFAAFNDQKDIDEDCTGAMELMNALAVIKGDNHGNANPTATITRAEAAAMMYRLMNKGKNDASIYNGMKIFDDVPSGIWYEGYVNYCFQMGIISGRAAKIFAPNAPVTGLEIAKMLLGACGYDADKQGYKGADWARNVHNDANSAEMLENYGMPLSVPAQRQWVAVMFSDALSSSMVRYYLGELTEVSNGTKIVTLGEKKFDFVSVTGTVVAIDKNTLVDGKAVGKRTVVKVDGKTDVYESFLTVADKNLLGQQVNVYYKDENTDKVFGIYATGKSKVGVSTMDALTKSTDTNPVYTVGTAKGTADKAVVFYPNANDVAYMAEGTTFKAKAAEKSTAPVRAIDTNGDGAFEYMLIDYSKYGTITIDKQGNYTFTAGTFTQKFSKEVVADKFNFVNEVKSKAVVKATANVWTGKIDIEALSAVVGKLTHQSSGNYTIAGTTYVLSSDKVEGFAMPTLNLKDQVELYTDGKYIVTAGIYQAAASTDMPTLVLVTGMGSKETVDPYTGKTTTYLFKGLGLDNKVVEYEFAYDDGIKDNGDDTKTLFDSLKAASTGKVFELKDNKDGTYYFVDLAANYASKKYTQSIVSGTALDLTLKTARLGNALANDAKFFMTYTDAKGNTAYAVVTLADLKKDQTVAVGNWFYYTTNNGIQNVVVGTFGGNFDAELKDATYGVTTTLVEQYVDENDKIFYGVKVLFPDAKEAKLLNLGTEAVTISGKYSLVTVTENNGKYTIAEVNVADAAKVSAVAETLIQITGGNLTNVASNPVVALKTPDNEISYVTMDDIISIYKDANAAEHDDYKALNGKIVSTDKDGAATVLYFEAIAK